MVYNTVRIDSIPQPGAYQLDKNGAKVYTLPTGCEVESFKADAACWAGFGKVTVEDDCEYVTVKVGPKLVNVSTNPSVAVFDHETGGLRKVKPTEALGCYVPVLRSSLMPSGSYGTFDDGWLLGVMVGDGYVTEKYLGYTKLEDALRNKVIELVGKAVGDNMLYKQYREQAGKSKLAESCSIHFTDRRAIEFGRSLNMYSDTKMNALTKRIPMDRILNGSVEYLVGIFCGMMDGDGSMVLASDNVEFRYCTSSKAMADSINTLAYRLGVYCSTTISPPRNWSKTSYTIHFRSADLAQYVDIMQFHSQRNRDLLETFKMKVKSGTMMAYTQVPLTATERVRVFDALINATGVADRSILSKPATPHRRLLKCVGMLYEDSKLYHRITNTDIEWHRLMVLTPPQKATVYDLLVPDTKVFAVNNGLVIYDTISWHPLHSDEANQECNDYNNQPKSFVLPSGQTTSGVDDLCKITMRAMTRDVPELHQK